MIVRLAALGFLFAALVLPPASPAHAEAVWQTLPPLKPLPRPEAEGRVEHDGARIYYRTFGSGAPVILLHGGLASGDYWCNQVPALVQAGYRAILIDSRGHGRSSRDAGERMTPDRSAGVSPAVVGRPRPATIPAIGRDARSLRTRRPRSTNRTQEIQS